MSRLASLFLILTVGIPTAIGDDRAQRVDIYGDPLPDEALARLGTVRYRGLSGSGGLQFLPDGRTLLGFNRGNLIWMDVENGRTLRTVETQGEYSRLLAVSLDLSLAAIATREIQADRSGAVNGLVIVETSTGSVRTTMPLRGEGSRLGIQSACFTPDSEQLVTGEHQGILRVWAVATGREERIQTLPDAREIRRIDISADGKWMAVCNYRAAYRWDWQSEYAPVQFNEPDERLYTVAFSPDGRTVVTGADSEGGMRLFDVETGRQLRRLSAPKRYYYPDQLALTSDGSRLAAPSQNSLRGRHPEPPGEIDVWDVNSGELLHALPFQEGLRRVAISPDDRWIVASVYEGTLAAWNLESGRSVSEGFFGHLGGFASMTVSPDGTLVATGGDEGWAVLWDIESGRPRHVLNHDPGKMVRGLAFSPDGSLLATSALDDTVVIWDTDTGESVYTLFGHGELGGQRSVRFTANGGRLLSFGDDWFLRVFDVRTGKALVEHAVRPSGLSLKSNVDGSVNTDDDRMMFLSIPSGFFTPDGESMVLAVGGEVYLIDVETGMERQRQQFGITHDRFAISPDGARIAFLSQDPEPSLQICNLSTGDPHHTIAIPEETVTRITFSADGSKLATTSDVIRVYEIDSGRELARLEPEVRAGFGQAFTPDGERLVVRHADTTALVWDWRQFLIDEEGN